jgi:putative transport protein
MNLTVENPNLAGLAIGQLPGLKEAGVVISRYQPGAGGEVRPAAPDILLRPGDHLMAVGTKAQLERCRLIIGSLSPFDLVQEAGTATLRRVVLTNRAMLGRTVHELGLDHLHNVTVTRVSRGDLIFTAQPDLRLQFGDMLNLVGDEESLNHATKAVGNAVRMLEETKFAAIFAGILLGVLLGLYPFRIEGLPAPVRLGLAGGPLIVAIVLSHIGRLGPLVLHMPINANRALRELGIILFLANVGLLSGGQFVATVFTAEGLQWMVLGLIVTMLPLLVVGWAARRFHQLNFMRLCGLLSGGMTDPPALAFSTAMARNDAPAIAYAAVYPLTMLLRIVAAQIIAQLG